ncbi:hypothetical protein PJ985_13700 [Streptomyces sp. ACA25]|uniref:HGxxPAAW family protein n=1 Tax=Streptomyces sp. ACA25 TaxID=3022596 RepID=UPI002307D2E3|nr:HGxxPAAW family protein [Streptomyces sp. ACA25]MDB1088622.1 hypothetical protein [Streptomyces sp. ACA25]
MAGNSHGHGNNPAAWTCVIIILLGFTVGAVFMVMAEPLGVVAGLVVIVLGVVVGLVMNAMGLGEPKAVREGRPQPAEEGPDTGSDRIVVTARD